MIRYMHIVNEQELFQKIIPTVRANSKKTNKSETKLKLEIERVKRELIKLKVNRKKSRNLLTLAEKFGYKSLADFCEDFKTEVGVNPLVYAREYRIHNYKDSKTIVDFIKQNIRFPISFLYLKTGKNNILYVLSKEEDLLRRAKNLFYENYTHLGIGITPVIMGQDFPCVGYEVIDKKSFFENYKKYINKYNLGVGCKFRYHKVKGPGDPIKNKIKRQKAIIQECLDSLLEKA